MSLQQRLHEYITNPNDSDANFNLAHEYEKIGQTGSALSWYLRSAEKAEGDDLKQYECLLHCALCLERQKTRDDSTKVLLLKAIALLPQRPEAYFLVARLHERGKIWQDSYTMAELGLQFADFTLAPLPNVEYPGKYGILFEKGVAAWWIAFCDESREIMVDLEANYEMNALFKGAVERNLATIGYPYKISTYFKSEQDNIRFKFKGIEAIERNWSQTYQDLFVLSMLNGKRDGTYLEIGCAEPFKNNNTALLETEFDWWGISVDINREVVEQFTNERENLAFCLDATRIDYAKFIRKSGLGPDVDYLQLDCDPPARTYEILQRIPFDEYRFATITFEHDFYADPSIRERSREFLTSRGYLLVASDIAFNATNSYEDWWVHPQLVDSEIIAKMTDVTPGAKYCRDYLFPKR
jgi:hypothetical protein